MKAEAKRVGVEDGLGEAWREECYGQQEQVLTRVQLPGSATRKRQNPREAWLNEASQAAHQMRLISQAEAEAATSFRTSLCR